MLIFAGLVLIGGITTSDYLCDKSWTHVCAVGLITMVVVSGSLIWLDHWAISKKTEQEAHTAPPPLPKRITNAPSLPPIAFVRTPKRPRKSSEPSNTVTGNQNVTGNKITGSQVCPGGICAGGDITGSPSVTNNFGPPEPKLTWTRAEWPKDWPTPSNIKNPRSYAKISLDRAWNDAKFAVFCDRKCIGVQSCGGWGFIQTRYISLPEYPNAIGFIIDGPNPLPADTDCYLGVESTDSEPVRIEDVQKLRLVKPR
jgi:hypothetical protein